MTRFSDSQSGRVKLHIGVKYETIAKLEEIQKILVNPSFEGFTSKSIIIEDAINMYYTKIKAEHD